MKKVKRLLCAILMIVMITGLTACSTTDTTTVTADASDDVPKVTYEVKMYDNQGNNFINFEGQHFTITPNKVKQYGYNTDCTWSHWYEMSSVVTISIDGSFIESCGSTVIFKDKRLQMIDIPDTLETKKSEGEEYSVTVSNDNFKTYIGLTNWWYDMKEKGQNGKKIILIQSQDGYNIGAFVGEDVTWGVTEKLPKTTSIMIDGLPLYIHRCNFTIIDSTLIEKSLDE